MKIKQISTDEYRSVGISLKREYGLTPNGNKLYGRWVFREDGCFVDYNQYRNDLIDKHNLKIQKGY